MRFIFLVLLSSMISCSGKNDTDIKAKSVDNIKLVNEFYMHFNSHDWQKMASMYADTSYFKDPSFGTDLVIMTPVQIAEKYAALGKIFPDLKDSLIATYPSGDKHVFVEFISTGTGPDGSQLYLPIATVFKIENGKITQDYTYYDNMEPPQQDSSVVKK